jgi:hypothetical protein
MISRLGGFLGALTVISKIDFHLGAVYNFNTDVYNKFKAAGKTNLTKDELIHKLRERLTTINIFELFDKVDKQDAMIKTLIEEKCSLEARVNRMGGEDLG